MSLVARVSLSQEVGFTKPFRERNVQCIPINMDDMHGMLRSFITHSDCLSRFIGSNILSRRRLTEVAHKPFIGLRRPRP